jgi:hypothetical protein
LGSAEGWLKKIAEGQTESVSDAQKKPGLGRKGNKARQTKKLGTGGSGMINSEIPTMVLRGFSSSNIWSQDVVKVMSQVHIVDR